MIQYVKSKATNLKTSVALHLQGIQNIFRVFQYVLAVILVSLVLQIVFAHFYSTVLLIGVTSFSYLLVLILLGSLSLRFISWFRLNRTSVGLCYTLTCISLAINSFFSLIYVDYLLLAKPPEIGPFGGGSGYPVSLAQAFYLLYIVSTIVSFLLTWAATVLLLHHYSRKLGKIKYWIFVSIPLIYFLSQFLTLFPNVINEIISKDPVYYSTILTLAFTLSKIAGGIFFGLAFWFVAKNLPHGNTIRDYMIICAYGFIFFFISNQAIVLVIAPYPPFGLIAAAYAGLSAYLILIGIYSSALSVSQDISLRRSIKKLAKAEPRLLDSIGMAQVEKEIQSKVIRAIKCNQELMSEKTGVESSLTEEDINQYLNQVLKEVKKN